LCRFQDGCYWEGRCSSLASCCSFFELEVSLRRLLLWIRRSSFGSGGRCGNVKRDILDACALNHIQHMDDHFMRGIMIPANKDRQSSVRAGPLAEVMLRIHHIVWCLVYRD